MLDNIDRRGKTMPYWWVVKDEDDEVGVIIQGPFSTEGEATAFREGAEWVNDSSVEFLELVQSNIKPKVESGVDGFVVRKQKKKKWLLRTSKHFYTVVDANSAEEAEGIGLEMSEEDWGDWEWSPIEVEEYGEEDEENI